MKLTTELTYRDKNFLLSASSNGIFIDLFSINGWLLQLFAVDILLAHESLVGSLVLAYPVIMALELCALALVAYVDYRKFLVYSFIIRALLVVGMLISAYHQTFRLSCQFCITQHSSSTLPDCMSVGRLS
jgi:hypothetical protein